MFEKTAVPFAQIYEADIWATNEEPSQEFAVTLRFQNRKEDRMGLALPAGKLVAFKQAGGPRLLPGEGSLEDTATGAAVEITISDSSQVRLTVEQIAGEDGADRRYSDMKVTRNHACGTTAGGELKREQ